MLVDSLELFRKLRNKKAIGIASNNLGNTMLTMYRSLKSTGSESMCGMSKGEIVDFGCQYFRDAINLGEEAIEKIHQSEGFSVSYLIFMQQLSNRYFNRAMFLLTVREDHQDPKEAQRIGLSDLRTCMDMDREVVDNGDQEGFKGERDIHFELLLSRIKGLLLLLKIGYEDKWDVEDLFEEAHKELGDAMDDPDHTLFRDIGPSGQMQRLEEALMEYHCHVADKACDDLDVYHRHLILAGRVGIRMLVEDEYLIGESALLALTTLERYTRTLRGDDIDTQYIVSELIRYRGEIDEALGRQHKGNNDARESFFLSNMGDVFMECF